MLHHGGLPTSAAAAAGGGTPGISPTTTQLSGEHACDTIDDAEPHMHSVVQAIGAAFEPVVLARSCIVLGRNSRTEEDAPAKNLLTHLLKHHPYVSTSSFETEVSNGFYKLESIQVTVKLC